MQSRIGTTKGPVVISCGASGPGNFVGVTLGLDAGELTGEKTTEGGSSNGTGVEGELEAAGLGGGAAAGVEGGGELFGAEGSTPLTGAASALRVSFNATWSVMFDAIKARAK